MRLMIMVFLLAASCAWAGHSNITHMDVQQIFVTGNTPGVALSSSGTIDSLAFRALEKTTNQSVLIQASGASPNYLVQLLETLDRDVFNSPLTVLFVKPEIGGDLYTFTDALPHLFPLYGPACLGQKIRCIGQGGGAVNGSITASELSQ